MTTPPEEIAKEAIRRMNKKITNEVFLIIQNDRDLMREYLGAIETHSLNTVNQIIGREIKKAYHLEHIDDREDNPACTLIQTHQNFE